MDFRRIVSYGITILDMNDYFINNTKEPKCFTDMRTFLLLNKIPFLPYYICGVNGGSKIYSQPVLFKKFKEDNKPEQEFLLLRASNIDGCVYKYDNIWYIKQKTCFENVENISDLFKKSFNNDFLEIDISDSTFYETSLNGKTYWLYVDDQKFYDFTIKELSLPCLFLLLLYSVTNIEQYEKISERQKNKIGIPFKKEECNLL